MLLKPGWDDFTALASNGLVVLRRAENTDSCARKKSELFYVHGPTNCKVLASFSDAVEEIAMHTRCRTSVQAMKRPSNYEKIQVKQTKELQETARETASSRQSSRRERKIELQKDIEKLRKKLRYEENMHRALERAFTRPLGALPRLPPYLSPETLELLAEVAVLEEEVVRLEEQIVNLRQGFYQEAVHISSFRKQMESVENVEQSKAKKPEPLQPPSWGQQSVQDSMLASISEFSSDATCQSGGVHSDRNKATSVSGSESKGVHFAAQVVNTKHPIYKGHSDEGTKPRKGLQKKMEPLEFNQGKENQLHRISRNTVSSSQFSRIKIATQKEYPMNNKVGKINAPKVQTQHSVITGNLEVEYVLPLSALQDGKNIDPNRISEEMVKCCLSIFLKLRRKSSGSEYDTSSVVSHSTFSSSTSFGSRNTLSCKMPIDSSEEINFRDPYGVCIDSELRDVGPYKHLHDIVANSIDLSQMQNSSPLLRRLKILASKLSSVDLRGLTHQQRLAFWINIYNVCMMNAFLEHGIPANPQMLVALMHKAIINVGGHLVHALTIEHFILRLPYHSKDAYPKGGKKDKEATMRSVYGLEWPEPLVTFALSCGSWSSPAVRVYTAADVEKELEVAKKEYLQAAVGVTTKKKLLLPKLLDWYLRDFAKDVESLLDWICLQLPNSLRDQVVECLQRGKDEMVSQLIEVMPYEFDFRFLFAI